MMLQPTLNFKDMFKVNSKVTKTTLVTKTKSIVSNLHGQAMQTNSKLSEPKAQNPKQNF